MHVAALDASRLPLLSVGAIASLPRHLAAHLWVRLVVRCASILRRSVTREEPVAVDASGGCGANRVRCSVHGLHADDEVSVAVVRVRRPSVPPSPSLCRASLLCLPPSPCRHVMPELDATAGSLYLSRPDPRSALLGSPSSAGQVVS